MRARVLDLCVGEFVAQSHTLWPEASQFADGVREILRIDMSGDAQLATRNFRKCNDADFAAGIVSVRERTPAERHADQRWDRGFGGSAREHDAASTGTGGRTVAERVHEREDAVEWHAVRMSTEFIHK